MIASFYERNRFLLLGAVVCLAPLVIWGATSAMGTNANDVRTWLPQGLPETIEYTRFTRDFGSEEFVIVSWEGCTLDDPRLEQFRQRLTTPADGEDPAAKSSLIDSVLTGTTALEELTTPPINLTHEEAVARLRGFAIGPDGKQSCAVVRPTERGKHTPRELLESVYVVAEQCKIPRAAVRMAGPLVTSVAVDEKASTSLNVLGPISMALAVAFSWMFFRNLRLSLLVITVSVLAAATALAALWFTGGQMNAVLVSMPPLVYVSTMSGAIHWSNYYRDTVIEHGTAGAPERAVAQAWLPLALATGTTAVGLLSLMGSNLLPIRQFGFYSAIGVAASLPWLLLVLPAGCAICPLRLTNRVEQGATGLTEHVNWWSWGQRLIRYGSLLTVASLTLAAVCGWGLKRITTSVTAEKFFSDNAPYPQNCRWLETHLGGSVPLELVLHMESTCQLTTLQRLQLIDSIQKSVAKLDEVGTSISAVTFSPKLPQDAGDRWTLKQSVLARRLEHHRDRFVKAGFLVMADGEDFWRISLRTKSFQNVDQRYFIDEVRTHVGQILEDQRRSGSEGISATLTGMVPLIERSQQSLLEGLIIGLSTDLLLIVVVIIVMIRHWSVGLILLITSVLPIVIVLGLLSWLRIPLDIGSVLAPSVALGVTVDDVLHFVLWFRRGLAQGLSREQAVRLAYQNCARAMFQSWVVIGLALSIFGFSDFAPTQRFGLMMISLLSVGLVVNLGLLPALLTGPLGGFLAQSIAKAQTRANRILCLGA